VLEARSVYIADALKALLVKSSRRRSVGRLVRHYLDWGFGHASRHHGITTKDWTLDFPTLWITCTGYWILLLFSLGHTGTINTCCRAYSITKSTFCTQGTDGEIASQLLPIQPCHLTNITSFNLPVPQTSAWKFILIQPLLSTTNSSTESQFYVL
jgi:hypothetical protein